MDSLSDFSYSPKYNKISNDDPIHSFGPMQAIYPEWVKKNLFLGKTFINCKEGYFKEDIIDYLKPKK